ncbi:MAG: Histidine N-alpha-methyltransferase [Alphaproteobacteria bacterium MarineAlpha3_Bin3]|jgi:dimethylhistidine N-methyltransferase|nr:MAG: Histidine N-alpha-methyltransferase [Alphaproteobacteria bacterium MarineAlpha3_Bin3]
MDTTVQVIDSPDRLKSFRDDVFEGLSREQKELPCKYFYDDRGSELFNTICGLDEYYPTRTETALLQAHGREMADLIGPGVCLIEFGCGSLLKTRLLLDALRSPAAFVPIDISADHLLQSAAALAADYPNLEVLPVVADFTRPVKLPDKARKASENRIGFFPGSTIGNFDHAGAADFLATVADMVGGGGALLIGVDLKKDEDILVRAYDDAQGVTAAFNRNVLERINRELGGCFDIETFRHRALYNGAEGRIEMHLVSEKDQTVTVHDRDFTFTEGETIHTEDSYKYHVEEFSSFAAGAGFRSARTWVDGDGLFSLHYLTLG